MQACKSHGNCFVCPAFVIRHAKGRKNQQRRHYEKVGKIRPLQRRHLFLDNLRTPNTLSNVRSHFRTYSCGTRSIQIHDFYNRFRVNKLEAGTRPAVQHITPGDDGEPDIRRTARRPAPASMGEVTTEARVPERAKNQQRRHLA